MPNSVNGALSINDAVTQKELVYPEIVKTSRVWAPVLMDHMGSVSKIGSKSQWFQQAISQGFVTLSAPYTIGDSTVSVDAPSNYNPFDTEIKDGVSVLSTTDGSYKMSITDHNGTFTSFDVSNKNGTPADLPAGTKLYIQRDAEVGSGFGSNNDTSVSKTDFNFFTNFDHDIRIANPIKDGRFEHFGANELDFANQEENLLPTVIRQLEQRVIKDSRIEGSNPITGAGMTRTSGNGAQAGGIYHYINAGGGYTMTSGTSALTEGTLEQDMIALRKRGAFTNMSSYDRSYAYSNCDAIISETTLSDIQSQIRLQRENAQGADGGLGSDLAPFAKVNGVKVNFKVSDGMEDNEVLYITDKQKIKVDVLRLFEQESEWVDGDSTVRKYVTTVTTSIKAPWTLGYRTNLIRV
ncbi:MAG: hypothetical protein HRT47_01460 [Candidatus Caenarcaniphilales bacterium]|nr:hypothetical protein [Candidatus Caenarcaniphilales bacterium]